MGRFDGHNRNIIHPRSSRQVVVESDALGAIEFHYDPMHVRRGRKICALLSPRMIAGQIIQNQWRLRASGKRDEKTNAAFCGNSGSAQISLKVIPGIWLHSRSRDFAHRQRSVAMRAFRNAHSRNHSHNSRLELEPGASQVPHRWRRTRSHH